MSDRLRLASRTSCGALNNKGAQPPPNQTLLGMRLITLYLPVPNLEFLDELVSRGFYPNRAEAIRLAVHDLINAEISRELKIEKVDVDVKESGFEIREGAKTFSVDIMRDQDGSIWGVYPAKPQNDDILFADGIRNLLILFRKGALKLEDFPRRKEAP